MLDRASTFAKPEIVELLKKDFVPVAIDQAYQRRQQDSEGDFYRRIAGQGPRHDFQNTTQGFYIATPSGKLLLYNNNRDPEKLLRLMRKSLAEFQSNSEPPQDIESTDTDVEKVDRRYNPQPPVGGLVLRVRAKVLGGYEPTDNQWRRIFQSALSRDNLWVTAEEHRSLVDGTIADSLAQRIARFHLVDNTRGEPPFWKADEIKSLRLNAEAGRLSGNIRLSNASGDRGFDAELFGDLEADDGVVSKLDFVVRGQFWGEGRYTGGAPKGKFPLAIWFTLADGTDVADRIPPQGSRGWAEGYLR